MHGQVIKYFVGRKYLKEYVVIGYVSLWCDKQSNTYSLITKNLIRAKPVGPVGIWRYL